MASAAADDALAGYEAAPGTFDEGFDAAGRPHPWARAVPGGHPARGPGRAGREVRVSLAHAGVTFQAVDGRGGLVRRPGAAGADRGRLDARQARAGPARAGAERVRGRRLRRAADRRRRDRAAAGHPVGAVLRARMRGHRAARRRVDRRRGARRGARPHGRVARARGQPAHAERLRLHARGAPRAPGAPRRPAGRDAAPAGRRDRPAGRRAARRRAEAADAPDAAGRRADRRRVQLARSGSTPGSPATSTCRWSSRRTSSSARAACRSARRASATELVDVVYRRTNDDRIDSPIGELLFEPIRRGHARAGQPVRHRRGRRQAHARLRRGHDPLLRRRGAGARSVPTTTWPSRRSSSGRWRSSTSSS